jgi:hypothetical protein
VVLELGNRSIEYVVASYQLLHIGIAAIPARKGSLSYNFASYYYRLCLQMHQIILWNRIGIHCSSRHLLFSLTESPPIATLGIIDGQTIGEFVEGQKIVQLTGRFVDGQTIVHSLAKSSTDRLQQIQPLNSLHRHPLPAAPAPSTMTMALPLAAAPLSQLSE